MYAIPKYVNAPIAPAQIMLINIGKFVKCKNIITIITIIAVAQIVFIARILSAILKILIRLCIMASMDIEAIFIDIAAAMAGPDAPNRGVAAMAASRFAAMAIMLINMGVRPSICEKKALDKMACRPKPSIPIDKNCKAAAEAAASAAVK